MHIIGSRRRAVAVGVTTAIAGIVLLAGCTAGTSTHAIAAPTVTKTVTAPPVSTTAPVSMTSPSSSTAAPVSHSTPYFNPLSALPSAPVPALCRHPAGTPVDGVLPGQAASTGFVELAWRGTVPRDAAALSSTGPVTGIGPTAVAAAVSCNAGGVPWADVIVFWRGDGTALKLVGSYSLDGLSKRVAAAQSVTITGNVVRVDWTGPTASESDAGGGLRQSATFTVVDGRITPAAYRATAG